MKTLRARLALICGLLAMALIIVGATGFIALKTVSENYDHVVEINLPNTIILQEMSSSTGSAIRQMVRLGYADLPAKEKATQSNAASAEEAAASSEVMLRQAKLLGEQVEQLQKIVG